MDRLLASSLVFVLLLPSCGDNGAAPDDTGTSTNAETSSSDSVPTSVDASSDASADSSTTEGSATVDSTSDGSTSTTDSSSGSPEESSSDGSSESSSSSGTPAQCGDGSQDPGEECDDANVMDDDGCDADCVPSVVVQIAGDGPEHRCVRTRTGAVRCWGRGTFGRLGYANVDNVGDNEVPSVAGSVDVGGDAVQLAAGPEHTCAVLDDGAVRCWGRGSNGRLGYANVESIGDNEVPDAAGDIDIGDDVIQVVTGGAHTCALLVAGTVRCWGAATEGQLGYGNTSAVGDSETPAIAGDVDIGGGRTAVQIAAGNAHTCALLDDGALRCWGWNIDGQLGLGHTDDIGDDELPSSQADVVVLEALEDDAITAIAAAYNSTCVLLQSGNVRCWGYSGNGECGYGSTQSVGDDETPASQGNVALGGTVVEVNAGPCARLDDGAVRCWGLGETGALGLGASEHIGDDELPDAVAPISLGGAAVHQHSDGLHACAVLDDGALRCWGYNFYGQLGQGNTENIGDDPGETPDTVAPVQVF